ncbi:MAG TPA: hypothetical protein VE980_25715 [Pyrinomonadaceae bacterium]|nr:hypothetical protein [Pyrinomonadaceae bacterium]
MEHVDRRPLAAFSVHVSVVNDGKLPLEIRDLLLTASTPERLIIYEPILLWDVRQWIEDGNRSDKVGRSQKGQVPLPIQLNAGQYFDFQYSILFLPLDKETMVEPLKNYDIDLVLYSLTDRNIDYVSIAQQHFDAEELKPLINQSFSSAVSTISRVKRPAFIKTLNSNALNS